MSTIEALLCKGIYGGETLPCEIGKLIDTLLCELADSSAARLLNLFESADREAIERIVTNAVVTASAATYYVGIAWEFNCSGELQWTGLFTKIGDRHEKVVEFSAAEGCWNVYD
jgi:hypothetical protein